VAVMELTQLVYSKSTIYSGRTRSLSKTNHSHCRLLHSHCNPSPLLSALRSPV